MLSKKQKIELISNNGKINSIILLLLEIASTIASTRDLTSYWPSNRTIMLRWTSKKIRKAIDKAKPPTQLNINWEIYREIKTNNIIERLNITDLIIYSFGDVICWDEEEYKKKYGKKYKYYKWNTNTESFRVAVLLYLNKKLLNFKICGLCNKSLRFLKPAFKNLQNLSSLDLSDSDLKWSTKLIKTLQMLSQLVSLKLSFIPTDISIKKQQSVKQFRCLKNLSLYTMCNFDSSYNILEFIEMCPTLNKLILTDNTFNYEWIKRLEQALIKCFNLTYLDLQNCKITTDEETYEEIDEDTKIKRLKEIQLVCPSLFKANSNFFY